MQKLKRYSFKKWFFMIVLGGALVYAILVFLFDKPPYSLRRNVSDSLSFTLFLSQPLTYPLQRESYVAFDHPKSTLRVAKQLVGLPGDQIKISDRYFSINGKEYGLILQKSRSDQPLHPIAEGIIPQGYVFVYADHPYSFDSRYAEFDLVPVTALKERLWPLF